MIIGLVLSSYPAYSETFFRNKIRVLQEAGHEVILFTDRPASQLKEKAICRLSSLPANPQAPWQLAMHMLRILGRRPGRSLAALKSSLSEYGTKEGLRYYLRSSHIFPFKLDWLHFGFATTAVGREKTAQMMNARMAMSIRGFDIAVYPLKHPGCYQKVWEKLDQLHTISDDLLKLAKENGLADKTRVMKITPAIDTNQFVPQSKTFEKIAKWQLITVARLHWKKGLIHSLEALSELKQHHTAFQWHLIGEGPMEEELIYTINQLGLQDHVILHGRLPHQEVRERLKQAHVYVQFSLQEGFCNAVLEAQAMGLITIVSDAEGLPENVEHGKSGIVVPKRRPDLLAAAIKQLMNTHATDLHQMSAYAAKRVETRFNLKLQQSEFLRFYEGT